MRFMTAPKIFDKIGKIASLGQKSRAAFVAAAMICPLWMSTGCATSAPSFGEYDAYVISPLDGKDRGDVKWADYLLRHLSKRAQEQGLVRSDEDVVKNSIPVSVDINGTLETDYAVVRNDNGLVLQAKTPAVMTWLLYQFIARAAAEDARVKGADLPPAYVDFSKSNEGKWAFEYRGLYTPSNNDADLLGVLGTNNVDFDWGLWGHNLHKVFAGDDIPQNAFALVDGARNEEQYCFSSPELYDAVEAYIIDQFGDKNVTEAARISIMPNDNALVCQCDECREAGNTPTSATPAVTRFIESLAKRFPMHQFFTSSYTSTAEPPTHSLPKNVCAIVSSLNVPLVAGTKSPGQLKKFDETIAKWKHAVSRIYVWDYMRNFDDYFTPYPCLHILQDRLRHFRDLGVSGVFFNGSGYDYASFDDVQTYVLSALMIDPDIDVDAAIEAYIRNNYPQTADLLLAYYTEAEKMAYASRGLQPYSGIGESAALYIDRPALDNFVTALDKKVKTIDGAERTNVNRLLTALAFTRLELMRYDGAFDANAIDNNLEVLGGYKAFEDMKSYREAFGSVAQYVEEWDAVKPWRAKPGNVLAGVKLTTTTPLEETNAPAVLTDARRGFPTDYHTGWVVAGDDLILAVPAGHVPDEGVLYASFFCAPKWRIQLPEEVQVWQGGRKIAGTTVSGSTEPFTRTDFSMAVSGIATDQPLEIRIIKAAGKRTTLAVDEIEWSE